MNPQPINIGNADFIPFIPISTPTNRHQKRALVNEIKRNIKSFNNIELMFVQSLFDDDMINNYRATYLIYLDLWNTLISDMAKSGKFKLTIPKFDYFQNIYAPMESPY